MNAANQLSEQQITTIQNEFLDENSWLFQLGISSQPDLKNTDNDFSFPFFEKGKETWEKYKPQLKRIICNQEGGGINSTFEEAALGNGREIILILFMELANLHNIPVSIAIPLIALLLKKNLQNFCSNAG